jgi:hypothetical protein
MKLNIIYSNTSIFSSSVNIKYILQVQGCPEARVAASLGSRPLHTNGKSSIDDRIYTTFYDGFKIGKDTANKHGRFNSFLIIIYVFVY